MCEYTILSFYKTFSNGFSLSPQTVDLYNKTYTAATVVVTSNTLYRPANRLQIELLKTYKMIIKHPGKYAVLENS